MYKISLTNFRCFADPHPLEVLPVTFLVGENSTGKTTFLAALRQLITGFSRSSGNPFNTDPYFLGGFDQIAHYRGGKAGRARYFSLELSVPAAGENRPATTHKFTFVKGSPQPELAEYIFTYPEGRAILDLKEKAPIIKIEIDGVDIFTHSSGERMPPSAVLKYNVAFVRYVFEDLLYRPHPSGTQEQRTDSENLLRTLVNRYRQSARYATRNTFATAPVRTQPLRTYTPSEITDSSEGSHVPLEMARQKTSQRTEWKDVHEKLVKFGHNSGLFDDIDIRSLGKRDGDPFQVVVKTKGPPVNLVDVGYGVSQALPVIYQLEESGNTHNAFLLQQPEVHLHPKAQAELGTLIAQLSKRRPNSMYVVETHSDYIIDRVRMEIAKGNLNHKTVTILFFQREKHDVLPFNIYLSEKGEILHPPDDFRSFFLEEHARLLGI